MQSLKPWYTSKTIWGAVIAVVAGLGSTIGLDIDDAAREQLVEASLQIVGAGGALLAVFGRIVATDLIE